MFIVKYFINIVCMPSNSSKKFDIESFFLLIAAEIWKDNCETHLFELWIIFPLCCLSSTVLFFKCAPGLQIRKFMLF